VLPLLVRGRSPAFDLLAGALWAAGLVAAHAALADLLASTSAVPDARGAVAGAVIGALGAVAASAAVARRDPPGALPAVAP
jgi:hypothetical protein